MLLTRQPMKYYIWNLSCVSLHSFKPCPLSTAGLRPISPSSLPSQSCSLLLGNPAYSRTQIPGDRGDVCWQGGDHTVGGAALPTPGPLKDPAEVFCSCGDGGHGRVGKGNRVKYSQKEGHQARRCPFTPRFSHKHSVHQVIRSGPRSPLERKTPSSLGSRMGQQVEGGHVGTVGS